MVASPGILVPVEDDRFRAVVDFYGSALAMPVHSEGVSSAGNPWHRFVVDGVTLTVHMGSGGKFPYPEFRQAGHGVALAVEVAHVSEAVARLESCRVSILNEWDYGDGTIAISVADPAGNVCEIWDRP
ncbi:VOC family protein [Burkholderia sp. Ac-20345]|uniref:VOC family protein n=1 Tax=Burkholderia sp. Ac-20345 TaxID=2703891 RepID=UPI00197B3D92|nr:VOC family protein [Burkholderia sp. Ac-20345]MBN3777471.1 VOC family protein [Burkholderia sp. Ac-20345]